MKALLERIYDILFGFREYVLLAGLLTFSLVLLVLNDNVQVKRIRSVATVVFGVVQDRLSFIPSYFSLREENAVLRRINVELADEAHRLRDAKLENLRLRGLAGLKSRSEFKLVGAKVISKDLTLLRNTLTLDVGRADSVFPSMPVINESGLIGMVTASSDHFAVVNILLNTDFRASAKVERSRVDGIVAWDGDALTLKNVPKTLDVIAGDVILTSEYSSAFPPNLRVGVVQSARDQPGNLFKAIEITPSVDFVKLEEVFVVAYVPRTERRLLEQGSTGKK